MSQKTDLDLSGVYPPIATPFDSEENIDYGKLEFNMEKWNKIPFKGYVVMGSNGEYAYLNTDERIEMVSKVRNLAGKDQLILAGSGCESTRDTIMVTKKMADAGADAALVVTPCYYKNRMNNEAMENHFTKVADASPIPVILYSVPANTGIDLDPSVIIKLSSHPNIIGVKESGGDISKIGNLVFKTKGNSFQVIAGSASFLYPALSVGSVGGVCALANILGQECCDLQTLALSGKHAEAQALQHRLIAPNGGVTKNFGVSGLKAAMDWFGYYGGPVRSPLQPLNSGETETLRGMFNNSAFKC